jgi:steroid delta-isomerase-like uncharacterized protein
LANDPQVEALCREYHDAMWEYDFDRVRSLFDPEVVWEDNAWLHRYEGIDAVDAFFRTGFPPLEIRVHLNWMMATSEGYCVDTMVTGKHVQDAFGIPASNKTFAFRTVSFGKVRDGKIYYGVDTWSLSTLLNDLSASHLADGILAGRQF